LLWRLTVPALFVVLFAPSKRGLTQTFNPAGFQELVVETVPRSSCFAVVAIGAIESCDMVGGWMRSFIFNFPDVVIDATLFAMNPDPAQLAVEQDWFLSSHWPAQLFSCHDLVPLCDLHRRIRPLGVPPWTFHSSRLAEPEHCPARS
jgi:hypothetical protein